MKTKLRLSKAELFAHVGYEPHAGQLLVHQSKAPRRVVACGTRWGKTLCASHEILAALMEPRDRSLGWIAAPTYELANRIFREVAACVQAHFAHRIQHLDMRHQRLIVMNLAGGRSEARGKSADRPAGLLGEGLDWMVIEEAARLPDDIWSSFLSMRLVDRRGWCLAISTPMRAKGWFYKAYRRGRVSLRSRDPMYESWSSPTAMNPHIDPAVIEAERTRMPDEVFRQEYLGEFIGEADEPCELCHGPADDVPGHVVIFGKAELLKCAECGEPVDPDGYTLVAKWAGGKPHLRIIGCAGTMEGHETLEKVMYSPRWNLGGA